MRLRLCGRSRFGQACTQHVPEDEEVLLLMVLNYYKKSYIDPQTSRKFSFCFLTPNLWAISADFSNIIVVCLNWFCGWS